MELKEIQRDMRILIGTPETTANLKRWGKNDTQKVLNSGRIYAYDSLIHHIEFHGQKEKKQIRKILKESNRWVAKYVLKNLRKWKWL
jgi:hypothetical protein